ncbi:MAG: hypothetical protein ACD_7C00106G0001, partial [uncultured bacterium]
LSNIPRIKDIEELLHLIRHLGAKAQFIDSNEVLINSSSMKISRINLLHASKIRVSFMLFAPLLNKFKRAEIPNPGGCRIGARPIDRQINLMKALGINVCYDHNDGYYKAKLKNGKIQGGTNIFEKSSHTGTEFAILLGCLAKSETVIKNPSKEPEIDDLIDFLNNSGANIKKINNFIYIKGVSKLISKEKYRIKNDRNEAVTYAVFSIATGGDVTIIGIDSSNIKSFIEKVKLAGAGVKIYHDRIRFSYQGKLNAADIATSPHPGFMTDWQAPWTILMTQASGFSTVHETVFENRFCYVNELRKLGAQIEFFQPKVQNFKEFYQFNPLSGGKKLILKQAIKISGKSKLHNAVLNVSDLRAGASLLIAASISQGESVICGASIIDRGYEHIDKKLEQIGAKIKRI